MNVAVIGQGFVGLSLSVFLASKKINVFGVEINHAGLLIASTDDELIITGSVSLFFTL